MSAYIYCKLLISVNLSQINIMFREFKLDFASEHLLNGVNKKVIQCNLCPRLTGYISKVGQIKVKRYINENYWAKPLPSFGDANAKLLIVGLAPAAHGGN